MTQRREDVEAVVTELRASRRYRAIAESTLKRVAESALAVEGGRVAPAVKRAKRALHELYGAFVGTSPPPYARLEQEVRAAAAAGDAALRESLVRAMRHHASTRERIGHLDRFFVEIFERTGAPSTLLDVACGLNPLAVPWMPLGPSTTYYACDIDAAMIEFLDEVLGLLAVPHEAWVADALVDPLPTADVALLLKTIPCLERQRRGAGFGLVDALAAGVVVASFPTASLGGRSKGMATTHLEEFEAEARARDWRYDTLRFSGELAFLVWK